MSGTYPSARTRTMRVRVNPIRALSVRSRRTSAVSP